MNWLITPTRFPERTFERRRISALMSLLLISAFFIYPLFIIRHIGHTHVDFAHIWAILALLLYLLVRRGYYRHVVDFMVIASALFPLANYIAVPADFLLPTALFTAFSSMMIASVFSTRRRALQAVTLNLLVTLFLFSELSAYSMAERVEGYVSLIFLSILVSISAISTERDMKQLHQQTVDLGERQLQFRQLFDSLPEAILIHVNGKIIYANAEAGRLLREALTEKLLERRIADFIPIDDVTASQVDSCADSLTVRYEAQLHRASGQQIAIHVTAQPIDYQDQLATMLLLGPVETSPEVSLQKDIIATASNAILVTDADLEHGPHIRFVNPAFCELTGYQEEELIGRTPRIFYGPLTDPAIFNANYQKAIDGQDDYIMTEITHYRKQGNPYLAQWKTHPIYDENGKAQYLITAVQDVSERLNTQELLQTHIVQQAVVSELGLLSLSISDHRQLFEHAVVMCEQVLEMDNCVIFECQPRQQKLACIATSHIGYGIQQDQQISSDARSSQMAYALSIGTSIISENLQQEARFEPLPSVLKSQINSALSVIIPGTDYAYGVLTVYSQKVQSQIEDELYFLQAVANILGSFAERSKAHHAEREQREFAEALRDAAAMINMRLDLNEMLDMLMGYVRQVVPQVESGSIMLWDSVEQGYRFIYTWGFEQQAAQIVTEQSFPADEFPLMEAMIKSNSPMIVPDINDEPLWIRTNDIEDIGSYLGSPIIVQGECIGFFHLNSTRLAAFSEKDSQRLQTFADKVGTAIMNTRYALELEALVKERTEELQKERERIATILEGSGEGIFYTEDRRIGFANKRLCEITGYSLDEVIGQLSTMFRPKDLSEEELQIFEGLWETLERGEVARAELRLARKDGSIFEAGVTASAVGYSPQNMMRTVTILRDISQDKALDASKTRFIANAAHELRSPITSLKTRMYMIDRQPEKLEYHLSLLDQIVARTNRLVSDLLDMAYFEHGQVTLRPESTILQDVVHRIALILEPEAQLQGLKLVCVLPEEPIHIWADAHRMEQVITNLLSNAIHYTPAQGEVQMMCEADAHEQCARLYVKDTGEGIPPEDIDNIFEAFYRLNKSSDRTGTGLGLSITREIVELHKGTIRVESQLGQGSTFIVTLPLLEA